MEFILVFLAVGGLIALVVMQAGVLYEFFRDRPRERAARRESEARHEAADHCHREGAERVARELGVAIESLDRLAQHYAEANFPPGERFGALKGALSGFESRARSAELMEQLEAEEKAAMEQLTPEEREALDKAISAHRAGQTRD
jgi:hypothetical protein